MSLKILIDRKFKEAPTPEIIRILNELRIKALQENGYIGGETVVNIDNKHETIVISSWSSIVDWNKWLNSEERIKLGKELSSYLEEPEKIRILMSSADYAKETF